MNPMYDNIDFVSPRWDEVILAYLQHRAHLDDFEAHVILEAIHEAMRPCDHDDEPPIPPEEMAEFTWPRRKS